MRSGQLFALCTFGCGLAHAQSLGIYAMVPVVHDKPYVEERVITLIPADTENGRSGIAEEIRSTIMRDSAGRLREQTNGTPPDERGSFRLPWVRVLDPVAMLQTDLDVSNKTYHRVALPNRVMAPRPAQPFCTGPTSQPKADGTKIHLQYERLGRSTMQGVLAEGCRITTSDSTPGFSSAAEFWRSPELGISLSSETRYDSGRSDSDRVVSLRRDEPDAALFRVPTGYSDASTPVPVANTNTNPNLALLTEYGSIEWNQGNAILKVESSDAAREVGTIFRSCLGLAVSSERPFETYLGDLLDVTAPKWAAEHPDPKQRVFAAKPAKVRVEFQTRKDGTAVDVPGLLRAVTDQLNAQEPYKWEISEVARPHFTMYALVPHATRNEQGQLINLRPYMDTPITLPKEETSIAEVASQTARLLTQETGYQFSCCQSFVTGQPWGTAPITYQAEQKPAREVLADLIEKAGGGIKAYSAACEVRSREFCFIGVEALGRVNPTSACRIGDAPK